MCRELLGRIFMVGVIVSFLGACAGGAPSTRTEPLSFKSFKEYPDHTFNPKEYIRGMEKGGHNLLIWKSPSANLKKYRSVKVSDFGGRLLPKQDVFSYLPYIKKFNLTFQRSLNLARSKAQGALRIEGAIVECNPGSRAARYFVGFGAGRAASAAVCEVYEPGKQSASMRIYVRETSSSGAFGGDSVAMLNHMSEQVAIRLASVLDERIGQ